jgi:hypothetical protein
MIGWHIHDPIVKDGVDRHQSKNDKTCCFLENCDYTNMEYLSSTSSLDLLNSSPTRGTGCWLKIPLLQLFATYGFALNFHVL